MKTPITWGCLVLITVIGITSCSVEKRRYRNGYHVEWKSRNKSTESHTEKTELALGQRADAKRNGERDKMHESLAQEQPVQPVKNRIEQEGGVSLASIVTKKYVPVENETGQGVEKITGKYGIKKQLLKQQKISRPDDELRLILAVIFLLLGWTPMAVFLVDDTTDPFWLNLMLVIGGYVLLLVGIISLFINVSGVFILFAGLACLLAAFIHAIVRIAIKFSKLIG